MKNLPHNISLEPIGIVKNTIKKPENFDWKNVISEIELKEGLAEGLDGLEEFSNIIIVYWLHQVPLYQRSVIKVHPKGRRDLPQVGVFASRSPGRPNPIGITTVKLLERRANILKVQGLDAIDGSPVLDIKPHIPGYDSVAEARVPNWIHKLLQSPTNKHK